MKVHRYPENPLITPADVAAHRDGFEVIGAFNAGVTVYQGEIIMLLRVAERPRSESPAAVKAPVYDPRTGRLNIVELDRGDPAFDFSDPRVIRPADSAGGFRYLTSLSYLRIARSRDGRRFEVDSQPFLYPEAEWETYGVEDPRITCIDGTYYITYTAVSPYGVAVGLASTRDFVRVERHGLIFPPENKDVVLFPEAVNGKYYALHRPVGPSIGQPEIWIAESDDLLHWGNHRHLLGLREGSWDSARMGAGAVPIKTERGWLELYHAADRNNRYCMGAVLLALDDPTAVLARSDRPILEPEAPYEAEGFFGGVVFSCGALVDGDRVRMYYGAADTSMACVELSLGEILDSLVPVPANGEQRGTR